ncbi:IS3 family transposase, partial [Streptosporangium algeriense]
MSARGLIACRKTKYGVPHAVGCRILGVSQSWFCKWRDHAPTIRRRRRADLDAAITAAFEASGGIYGSPRIARDLHERGRRVSVEHSRGADGGARPGGSGAAH